MPMALHALYEKALRHTTAAFTVVLHEPPHIT